MFVQEFIDFVSQVNQLTPSQIRKAAHVMVIDRTNLNLTVSGTPSINFNSERVLHIKTLLGIR
jgi:hypothetical protein